MKRDRIAGVLAAVSAMIMMSCGGPDYRECLPANPSAAVSINVANLVTESEVMSNQAVGQMMERGLSDQSAGMKSLVDKIKKDPRVVGVDFRKPIIATVTDPQDDDGIVLVASVLDRGDLKKFVEEYAKEDNEVVVSEEGDYTVVKNNFGTTLMAFDGSRLVYAQHPIKFMELKDEERAISDKEFEKFAKGESDIAVYVDNKGLKKLKMFMPREMRVALDGQKIAEGTSCMMLNFDRGRVRVDAKGTGDAKTMETLKTVVVKPSKDNLDYIPEGAYIVANYGLRNLGKALEMNPEPEWEEVDRQLSAIDPSLKLKDILQTIDGDLTMAILPAELTGKELVPQFAFIVTINDKAVFEKIGAVIESKEVLKKVEGLVFATGANEYHNYSTWEKEKGGYDYYLGVVDNKLIIMPENIYSKVVKDGKMQSLSDHYSGSKLGSSLMVGDIEAMTKDLKRVGLVRDEEALRILNMIGDFSMESNVDGEGSLVINLTDGSTNALKQIVDVSVDMMK